uniref:Uncharacterized protein n=1 Tax=Ramularia collo-cygni TaxID=112498 RepID=A0A2D3VAH0_9PEZI
MDSQNRRSLGTLPRIMEEDLAEPVRCDIDRALGTEATRHPRNAFAEDGLRLHRHRLASNAFYQEQYALRKNTPPTMIHPALRYNTNLYDISQALPELSSVMPPHQPSLEMQQVSPRHARSSRDTTMSPFINAGFEERVPSPALKLAPSPNITPDVPTMRNRFEERVTSANQQEVSGRDDFVSVTRYSPKAANQEFGQHSRHSEDSQGKKVPASPKKSLLDRFRGSNRRGTAVPLQPLPSMSTADGSPSMPVKARAVLFATPQVNEVGRSPSKSKAFWSRRKPSVAEETKAQTPTSILKAPPHVARLPGHSRSHSLGYIDNSVPPTPLPKDTPPEEKARLEAAGVATIPLEDSTPTRYTGFMSLNNRASPSKFGGYGQRGNATLVAQPSVHSLRASVVPNAMDGEDFDQMKSRIDGLGLESFYLPQEENCQNAGAYSPSMYSPDVGGHPMSAFQRAAGYPHSPTTTGSTDTISPDMNISISYPELARDPSITSFMTPPSKTTKESDAVNSTDHNYLELMRHERVPPNRRGAIDVVINEVEDMLQGGEPSPSNSSLFAIPLGHASAQVSPLHLPSAVFNQQEYQHAPRDLQPVLADSDGNQILPATAYNPWDLQQQSNHSPNRETRLPRRLATQTKDKKSTSAMPGLQYDSGVDVDPKKSSAKLPTAVKHSLASSVRRSSAAGEEKYVVGASQSTDVRGATELGAIDVMGRGDHVKDLIAAYQQSAMGKRLSYLEESFKQDAIQERMRLEQDAIQERKRLEQERKRLEQEALFDQRLASLEIHRFNHEPSPTKCYETLEAVGQRKSQRKSLGPSHPVSDQKKMREPKFLPLTNSPGHRADTKRISTGEARDFYQNQLKDAPVMNSGNVDTSADARRDHAPSTTPKPSLSRVEAAEEEPRVPESRSESKKILHLQRKLDLQQKWIEEAMARMEALESQAQEAKK